SRRWRSVGMTVSPLPSPVSRPLHSRRCRSARDDPSPLSRLSSPVSRQEKIPPTVSVDGTFHCCGIRSVVLLDLGPTVLGATGRVVVVGDRLFLTAPPDGD